MPENKGRDCIGESLQSSQCSRGNCSSILFSLNKGPFLKARADSSSVLHIFRSVAKEAQKIIILFLIYRHIAFPIIPLFCAYMYYV
jgi:hypothetical protein